MLSNQIFKGLSNLYTIIWHFKNTDLPDIKASGPDCSFYASTLRLPWQEEKSSTIWPVVVVQDWAERTNKAVRLSRVFQQAGQKLCHTEHFHSKNLAAEGITQHSCELASLNSPTATILNQLTSTCACFWHAGTLRPERQTKGWMKCYGDLFFWWSAQENSNLSGGP